MNKTKFTQQLRWKHEFIHWLYKDKDGYYVLEDKKEIRVNYLHEVKELFFKIEGRELELYKKVSV